MSRLMKGAIACVVLAAAMASLVHQLRKAAPPRVEPLVIPLRPVVAPPTGPAMTITDETDAGRERKDNGLEMSFCWCPPGEFHMGANPVGVRLTRGFWMGKHEVTQGHWKRLMGATVREQRAKDPRQPRGMGDGSIRDHVGEGEIYPIYFVNHAEAEEFCRRLTEAEREAGRLETGFEYRLPTEAQWEFACRAGTTTTTAFGETFDSHQANFDGSQPYKGAAAGPFLHETTPVGTYPANAWGLHDMHGNVWEWCRDGYTQAPTGGTDPCEPATGAKRVYRGGCWHNPGTLCLSTSRGWGEVEDRGSGLGFRVALVRVGD